MPALLAAPIEATARALFSTLVAAAGLATLAVSAQAAPPEIRTNPGNRVPACVTPERLDAFIRSRNELPQAKFARIGAHYKKHGDTYRVRWDYAFYQMVIETNYLLFKRADGNQGDVSPKQNNFAGIGATGGGVPGETYRDVSTGVLAQIQHLVAYSGERVENPVAPRTRDRQDDIIALSLKLGRPVTFADLRNRWAADRNYARSIETIADRFKEQFCRGGEQVATSPVPATPPRLLAPPQPASRIPRQQASSALPSPTTVVAAPSPTPSGNCHVLSASYGGTKTVLIRTDSGGETSFTALTVPEGSERPLIEAYVKIRAPGGRSIGEFTALDPALRRARQLCPDRS